MSSRSGMRSGSSSRRSKFVQVLSLAALSTCAAAAPALAAIRACDSPLDTSLTSGPHPACDPGDSNWHWSTARSRTPGLFSSDGPQLAENPTVTHGKHRLFPTEYGQEQISFRGNGIAVWFTILPTARAPSVLMGTFYFALDQPNPNVNDPGFSQKVDIPGPAESAVYRMMVFSWHGHAIEDHNLYIYSAPAFNRVAIDYEVYTNPRLHIPADAPPPIPVDSD